MITTPSKISRLDKFMPKMLKDELGHVLIELPECESFRGRFDDGHQVVRELWRRPKASRFTYRYMKAQLTLAIFDEKLMNDGIEAL